MSVYSTPEEEKIRDGKLVRQWAESGLLDSGQSASLQSDLRTDLRQTNGFLRGVLWAFTILLVTAGVALFTDQLLPGKDANWAERFGLAGLACWILAEFICRKRLYRYGVEEALAVTSVVLFVMSGTEFYRGTVGIQSVVPLIVGALGGLALFYRFGFVYAALGSLICAAVVPFHLMAGVEEERLLSAMIFGGVLVLVRQRRHQRTGEPAGSASAAVESASWLGIYLVLNVRLTANFFPYILPFYSAPYLQEGPNFNVWFFRFGWAMIWILPAAGLWLGLRGKERLLIDVSVVTTLLTLSTNKRYLGWPDHSWDPMVLGVVLMVSAIMIRRWLQGGLKGERFGFTAVRLLAGDVRKLAAVSIASFMMQPHASDSSRTDSPHGFREGGGESGGGGATGSF